VCQLDTLYANSGIREPTVERPNILEQLLLTNRAIRSSDGQEDGNDTGHFMCVFVFHRKAQTNMAGGKEVAGRKNSSTNE
jgi:hypothetical protein